MDGFARSAILLFLALRAGDFVSLAAGMWFVPRHVSPQDIGAVLPLTSFATFLSLPVFAFAMTMMRESAVLAAAGERGKVRSLLAGMFAVAAAAVAAAAAAAFALLPRFLSAMRVGDTAAGTLAAAAAFLGCVAPVYTDALQALKRFKSLAAVEVAGAAVRFAVMFVAMPLRALAGYFAGQAALPLFRMAASVIALRRDLAVPAKPYWDRTAAKRVAATFAAVLAYQAAPMAAALVEQCVLRDSLPGVDSAGYYMASRFSDFLHCLTFPLLLVMFPYTAGAASGGASTRTYVLRCSATALFAAAAMAAVYRLWGGGLMALMPHGEEYAAYAGYMPHLVAITVLTTCQVFYTNAEVSAGRFGFLRWLVPLHVAYPLALLARASAGGLGIGELLAWFGAASALRFAFAAAAVWRDGKRRSV